MRSSRRSVYSSFRHGSQKWEDFVMKDSLPYMRRNFNVVQGREGTFITGISMGGMGSLRMAVKYPEVFQAVASQEPAIEPALAYDDITLRDKIGRPGGNPGAFQDRILLKQIYGDPIDKDYWAANLPSSRRTLRASWVSASISRSAIRTCFISTRARSSSIACCLMRASAMNIAWSRAQTTLALR